MVLWKGGESWLKFHLLPSLGFTLIVRRQARDELFKTSGDESKEDKGGKEQALYKTDMIKIRKRWKYKVVILCHISIYIPDILCVYIYIYVNYLTQCLGGIYCKSCDPNFKKGPSPSPPLKCTIVMCENELFSLTPSHPESSEKKLSLRVQRIRPMQDGQEMMPHWFTWSSSRVSLYTNVDYGGLQLLHLGIGFAP